MYKVNQELQKYLFNYFKPITKNFIIKSHKISQSFCRFSIDNFNINSLDHLPIQLKQDIKHFPIRRKIEFIAGRVCSAKALENLLPNGKYYWRLKNDNRTVAWPKNIAGSISHTNNVVTATTLKYTNEVQSIGVDIEKIMSTQKAKDLSQTILKSSMPHNNMVIDITYYVTMVFSAKESLYKAFSSIGITIPYENIFCIDVNTEKRICTLYAGEPINKALDVYFYFSKYYNLVMTYVLV